MDITVKCPNCYQQVSREERYCIFCGYDLTKSKSDVHVSEAASVPADEPPAGATSYDGPRYCPNGHDVADPSLGFCMICGSPLVNTPSSGAAATEAPSSAATPPCAVRRCSCGYECDDPDLSFCPSCGKPFDEEAPADGGTSTGEGNWTCPCGQSNSGDMGFCIACGQPRGWRPSEPRVEPTPAKTYIPEGMKPPTDNDLEVKAKYGN